MTKDDLWGGEYNWDSPNVASSPERCGLEIVAGVEYSDECYQFDTRIVWKHLDNGRYYTARSSGCSCPTPFEEFRRLSDLEDFDYRALQREVNEELGKSYCHLSHEDARAFLAKIRYLRQPHAKGS